MEDYKNKFKSKKRKRMTGDFCCAINCVNARRKVECRGLSFFGLPFKDEQRCKKWILNMRRQDLVGKTMTEIKRNGYRLCSKHFEACQFNVPSERKRLKWNAVPTIFDVTNSPFHIASNQECDDDEMEPEQTPDLFMGSTKGHKEVLERDSKVTRCVDEDGSDYQEEQEEENSMFDPEHLGYCSALYCSKNCRSLDPRTGDTVDMHPFPDPETDKERCLKWITNLRNDFLNLSNVRSKKVCSLHFEASAYKYWETDGICTLLPDAVPILATQPSEENAYLINHLNDTVEALQSMLEEKQKKIKVLQRKLCQLESLNELKSKELEDSHKKLRRFCFLASLDS